ncbi:DNA replication inhibitor CspD (fragment) [Vibrio crassostreae]
MEGYRTLKAGQQVDYEVESGPKGSHASSVVPVEGSAAK